MRHILPLLVLPAAVGAQDIERRRLASPETISGVSCAATGRAYAELYADGSLRECPLARDTTIGGHAFGAGTWILLSQAGRLQSGWLATDTRLGGHLCRGKGYKELHVTFHDDQSLRSCYLAEDTVIAGVPCIHGSFWTEIRGGGKSVARFHPDGSLESCQLARDATVDGQRHRKWERVRVAPSRTAR